MDFIYFATIILMVCLNVTFMFINVRLLSVIICFISIGITAECWNSAYYSNIPFSPYPQLLLSLVAVVCLLVVGVRGKHVV